MGSFTSLTSRAPGVGRGSKCRTCRFWLCCRCGHACSTNTCLVLPFLEDSPGGVGREAGDVSTRVDIILFLFSEDSIRRIGREAGHISTWVDPGGESAAAGGGRIVWWRHDQSGWIDVSRTHRQQQRHGNCTVQGWGLTVNVVIFVVGKFRNCVTKMFREKGGAYCFAHVGWYIGRSLCQYPLTLCNW